ncbi:MAG TPA: hypothetical protein VLB76_06800 [Thermoanaerobaculia bacterium]|jgi:hypothetical protein|nr:hypothetical protein [Thermoanaerobaculia bacterium]
MSFELIKQLHPRGKIAGGVVYTLLLLLALYSITFGYEKIPTVRNPLPLDSAVPDDLWFLSDGSLVAVGSDSDHRVWIKQWSGTPDGPKAVFYFDFAQRLGVSPRYSLRKNSFPASRYVAYALDSDANTLAWAWNGLLHLQKRDGSPARPPIPLKKSVAVSALSFIRDSAVGVLYSDGQFLVTDWSLGSHVEQGTKYCNNASLWTQGLRIVLACLDIGDIRVIDFSERMGIDPVSGQYINGTVVALHSAGDVAIGTSDGVVVFPPANEPPYEKPSSNGLGKGPIIAMIFYDRDKVIVGGAFPGLYLVARDRDPIRLTEVASNIRLVAVKQNEIAYAGVAGITIASIGSKLAFTDLTATIWKWLLAFISISAFTLAIFRDRRAVPSNPQQ